MSLSIKAPKNFSETADFKYVCPECKTGFLIPDQSTFVQVEPTYSKNQHQHESWDPFWITYRFTVSCICNNKDCEEFALISGKGSVDQRYDYEGVPEYYDQYTIKTFFPSPRLCIIPLETPPEVESSLEISFALYWVDVSAAANSLRKSLEALLNEVKVPTHEKRKNDNTVRMNLHRRLEVWAQTNEAHARLCGLLKDVGNLGSHEDTVTPEIYLESLGIYAFVLKELYDNDSKKINEMAQSLKDKLKAINP